MNHNRVHEEQSMMRRLGISILVLVAWYGTFAGGLWASTRVDLASVVSQLEALLGKVGMPTMPGQWLIEGFLINFILCPATFASVLVLAVFKVLPRGAARRIWLFLVWQSLMTLFEIYAFRTALPQVIGVYLSELFPNYPGRPDSVQFAFEVIPTIVVITLPIHCAVLWYCFYRSAKDAEAARELDGVLKQQPTGADV